jgi:hypothetical protein
VHTFSKHAKYARVTILHMDNGFTYYFAYYAHYLANCIAY